MLCLTVRQPWASLIVGGHKTIETRTWATHRVNQARIAIHASNQINEFQAALSKEEPFKSCLEAMGYKNWMELPRGQVLGAVTLVEIKSMREVDPKSISERERAFGDFSPGKKAWYLAAPHRLAVPYKQRGLMRLFDIDDRMYELASKTRDGGNV